MRAKTPGPSARSTTKRPKKTKAGPPRAGPRRRSIYFPADLATAVRTQAAQEERKESDMIRILIQRGLRVSRGTPPTS